MLPSTVHNPYTFRSSDATYSIVPSTDTAGEDRTRPVVARDHNVTPLFGFNAYTNVLSLPTYSVPLRPIVNDD